MFYCILGLTTSSNPLLEYCLDGVGRLKSIEDKIENKGEQLPPLLALCSNFSSSNSLMPNNITCFTTTKSSTTAKENEQNKVRTSVGTTTDHSSLYLNPLVDDDDDIEVAAIATHQEDSINTCEDQSNSKVYKYLEGQLLCQMAESGCDINVQSSSGFTALHFLINGKTISLN